MNPKPGTFRTWLFFYTERSPSCGSRSPYNERQHMNRYDAVFFDIGGTLIHAYPDVASAFVDAARKRGHDVSLPEVLPYMDEVNAYYEAEYLRDGDFWCSHERSRQIWIDMYTMLANFVGLEHDAPGISGDLYQAYLHADHWAIYPDVLEALRALKRAGVRLGVISNWDASLEGLLRELKLLPYFDDIVASAAVGYRKPDRVVFDLALERMGVEPSRALHVGDLPEADGDGATSAGVRPVIIDRAGKHAECPYRRIASLEELESIACR